MQELQPWPTAVRSSETETLAVSAGSQVCDRPVVAFSFFSSSHANAVFLREMVVSTAVFCVQFSSVE